MSATEKPQARKTGPKPLPRNKCGVDGCTNIADHPMIGLCHMHYKRKYRTGSTNTTRRKHGSGTVTSYGYISMCANGKKKREHVLIAERALGKPLPPGAEVHHINKIKTDNRPENLVVCPSRAYHKLLHVRMDALEACGNASYRKCPFCKQYDDPQTMKHNKGSRYFYHNACKQEYRKQMDLKCNQS